jgi:hypothetical protein
MIARIPSLACFGLAGLWLLACSTSPSPPPRDDLTGQWRLNVRWATTPAGTACHLDAITLTLVAAPPGQTATYTGQFTGGSGSCTSQGQTLPVDGRDYNADSVFYSQGSVRMFIGPELYTGISVGAQLSGRYSRRLSITPAQSYAVTGTWEALGPQ